MNGEIAVALLSLAGTCFGSIIAVVASSNLTKYKIEELQKEVEKHNKVIERTFQLEKRADVFEEQIKVANHRIEDLEKGDFKK